MNDALVEFIHRIISKWDRQGRGSIDIDRYMEWNDIGLQTGPGTHNRRTENIVELMPTSGSILSPRFPQQQNGQQKTKLHRDSARAYRKHFLGSLQVSTLQPVPGFHNFHWRSRFRESRRRIYLVATSSHAAHSGSAVPTTSSTRSQAANIPKFLK